MSVIGVFDSGYGGLTILRALLEQLPQFDYSYLGDNARTPYGNRSFETVYGYTLECVNWLFDHANCALVILACNTASAKALRQIQQHDLPLRHDGKRLLGVIRPTTESLGYFSCSQHVGILGTQGTVSSGSYQIELAKFFPDLTVEQEACPLWVPLVENNELTSAAARQLVQDRTDAILHRDPRIDCLLLACTHYPLLMPLLEQTVPKHVQLLAQGHLVAEKLVDYLNRHAAFARQLSQNRQRHFYTTDSASEFDQKASIFFGEPVQATQVTVSAP